jgi:hypothetical protein
MSEYQYYEFQAVDRPLNAEERTQLRAISSRARITATSFVNTYNYGDLKGDPLSMLERYFDLYCYVANWGSRHFAMRLPRRFVDLEALKRFELPDDLVSIQPAGEHVIISITRDELDSEYLYEYDEYDEDDGGSGRMGALAPLRAELLAGDLQLFSLLWLLQLEDEEFPDDAVEPAPGLTRLSGALAALADFLMVDSDIVEAAAGGDSAAPASSSEPSPGEFEAFVRSLPEDEKTALLLRLCSGNDPHVVMELRRRCQDACRPRSHGSSSGPRRTAGELRAAARRIVEERERIAREEAKVKRRCEEEQKAKARVQRLAAVARRGEHVWREVEDLIMRRNASAYDEAATLLVDVGEIAATAGQRDKFDRRVAELCARHAKKERFIERLKAAGLPGVSREMFPAG